MGGKLTNADTEVGRVGGKLVTDISFNPQGPTCCSRGGGVLQMASDCFSHRPNKETLTGPVCAV